MCSKWLPKGHIQRGLDKWESCCSWVEGSLWKPLNEIWFILHTHPEVSTINAIHVRVKCLVAQAILNKLSGNIKKMYADVFSEIPHVDKLPKDDFAWIQLKDANKTIMTRSYSTPQKYKDTWATLIQHLNTGRIWPSHSQHTYPAFIIPGHNSMVMGNHRLYWRWNWDVTSDYWWAFT